MTSWLKRPLLLEELMHNCLHTFKHKKLSNPLEENIFWPLTISILWQTNPKTYMVNISWLYQVCCHLPPSPHFPYIPPLPSTLLLPSFRLSMRTFQLLSQCRGGGGELYKFPQAYCFYTTSTIKSKHLWPYAGKLYAILLWNLIQYFCFTFDKTNLQHFLDFVLGFCSKHDVINFFIFADFTHLQYY